MIRVPGLTERQCSTLVRDGDCIVRTTSINRVTGYSTVWFQGRTEYAHRVVALAAFGPPPFPGAVIDHFVCRRRDCVNPEHLRFVTNRENVLAGVGPSAEHARQTHCVHGHEFTPENTAYGPPKPWGVRPRRCRMCARLKQRRRAKARAAVLHLERAA